MFLSIYSSAGARLILFIVGDLMTSSDNPLDCQDEMLLVLPILLKYLFTGLNTKSSPSRKLLPLNSWNQIFVVFVSSFSTSKCLDLFKVTLTNFFQFSIKICVFALANFVIKFALANLALKTPAAKLLNSGVLIYLS